MTHLRSFRTSPVESLYTTTHKMPKTLRRKKLALQYTKLHPRPNNPAFNNVSQPQYKDLFNQKNSSKPLGLYMKNIINESRIDTTLNLESTTLKNPLTKHLTVLLNFAKHPTSSSTILEETDNT